MSGENTDPRAEPGIGRSLEEARQSKGLSLREVEQRTRIRSRYLRDLEREDFDVLPAVYVLGSLKTYADFLGLDGAALSGQLKARLTEPDEPESHAAIAADVHADERDDGYEAAPVPAVGFDQLFLGMGVILISILAIMTLATAVAQGDRSPVSQVDQPSTPESPSEVALAGNTQEEEGGKVGASERGVAENREREPGKNTETSKASESPKVGEKDDSEASSPFGDAEFVPMPSSSGSTSAPSTASASATSSASAAPATAKTEDRSASPRSSPAPATAEASPRPAAENRVASAPAPPSNAPTAAGPQGGGQPSPPASGAGPIPAEAARVMGETFRLNGP